MINLNSSN